MNCTSLIACSSVGARSLLRAVVHKQAECNSARSRSSARRYTGRRRTFSGAPMKIKSNGIQLEYDVQGEGPWVVMSHSLACASAMWDEQAQALKGKYKVLRFDT